MTKDTKIVLNPNKFVRYLKKPPSKFTKSDLIKYISENNIEMINFLYVDADSKLRTLNFVITSLEQLDRVLSYGERADGSNIFPYFRVAASDLYLIPRYKTAFENPFSEAPTVNILCSLFYRTGDRLEISPEYILEKAHSALKSKTGFVMEAMGELEYYVISELKDNFFPGEVQKGYHESAPFSNYEELRSEVMRTIAQIGGKIKYGHSEVGDIEQNGKDIEQHEIEFEPQPIEDMADQITLAKWVLRMIGNKYGVTISFAPKIFIGHAGNGLHIHSRLIKSGKNAMVSSGELTSTAKKVIAGYLQLASSLTAFGNTVPLSYLRLVPHQEAPTSICWGERNRSALIRIPLGWLNVGDMIKEVNPQEKGKLKKEKETQTIEFRAADGSANIYLLLAGLAVAARYGLKNKDSLKQAEEFYVGEEICSTDSPNNHKIPQLPSSCWESSEFLLKDREFYEDEGIFPPHVIDGIAQKLKSYNDKNLQSKLKLKKDGEKELIQKYLHCG